jgi:hypothetical protein
MDRLRFAAIILLLSALGVGAASGAEELDAESATCVPHDGEGGYSVGLSVRGRETYTSTPIANAFSDEPAKILFLNCGRAVASARTAHVPLLLDREKGTFKAKLKEGNTNIIIKDLSKIDCAGSFDIFTFVTYDGQPVAIQTPGITKQCESSIEEAKSVKGSVILNSDTGVFDVRPPDAAKAAK